MSKGMTSAAGGVATNGASSASVNGRMTTTKTSSGVLEKEEESDELMKSLKRHDQAFNSLLSLIPAQFYLAPKSEGSSSSNDNKGTAGSKNKKNKRNANEATDAATKKLLAKEAKRAKLDPDNFQNAAQIKQEMAVAKRISSASSDEMRFDMDDDDDDSRAGDTDSAEDDEEDDSSSATQLTSVKGSEEAIEKPAPKEQPSNGIQDLRARLQAKIQGLQLKRKAPALNNDGADAGGDDDSIASTKDELLEERRRKRGEMRDKRRQAVKERRRAEKQQQDKKGTSSAGNTTKGAGNGSKAPALLVPDRSSAYSSVRAKEGRENLVPSDLAFSSLDFGDVEGQKGKKSRHALPSDPKAALAILESRKRKEEAREAKRKEQGEEGDDKTFDLERREREKWSKVEAATQGVKIRDDEGLLKKAAKKKDKIKEKSRKEWSDRDRELKEQAASRQKKRNDNIAARKDRSKKGGKGIGGKKMGGGGKKTKARAGFEGKARHTKGPQQKNSRK